ncbi:MAG: hypothetical protein RXR02_07285 [Thermoproteus sp.]
MRLPIPAILSAAVVSIAAVYFVVFQTGQSPLSGYFYYPDGGKVQWLGPGVYKIYSAGPCPGDLQIGGKCFHLKQTVKADDPGQLPVLPPDSLVEVDMEPRITYVDVYIPKYNNTFKLYVCTDGSGNTYYYMYMESPLYTLWPTRASWVNGTDGLALYTGSYYIGCTPVPTDVDRVQFTSSVRGLATHYAMTWDPSGSVSVTTQRTAYVVYAPGQWWWIPAPGSTVQVVVDTDGSTGGPACYSGACYVTLVVSGDAQLPDPNAHIAWYSGQQPWSLSIGVGPPWPGGCGSLNGTITDNYGNVYNISIPSASCYYGVLTFSWSSTNIGPGAYAYTRAMQAIALSSATVGEPGVWGTGAYIYWPGARPMPITAGHCTIPGYISNGTCYVWAVVYNAGTAHLDITTLWGAKTFGSIYPPLDIYTGSWVLTPNGTKYAAWVAGSPAVSGAYRALADIYVEPPLYNITIYRYHTNLVDVLSLYGPQLVGLSYAYPAYQTTPYGLYDVSMPPVYANGVISAKVQMLPANQEYQEEDVAVVLTQPPPSIYAPSMS